MRNTIVLSSLALLTLVCAVLEGLFEGLPPQFIQLNGLLTIICTAAFILWTLKVQAGAFRNR